MRILFRPDIYTEEEMLAASKYFDVIQYRSEIKQNDKIIGRYSVLPYYKELEQDVKNLGGTITNTYRQHKFVANFEYYEILKDYTFETWDDNDFYLSKYDGPLIVKGRTNSRKFEWDTMMYAEDSKSALHIAHELAKDPLIGEQGIIYRKYIPLKTYSKGINGVRFTNEFRFFFYKGELVDYGYYWSNSDNEGEMNQIGIDKAKEIAQITKDYVNFYVIDMAETEQGEWVMVEMNDGQMSGLSTIPYDRFYKNLSKVVLNEKSA